MFYHIFQSLIYLPIKLTYPSRVYGRFPKGAAVITMNHTSNMDAVLMVTNTYEKKYFLAKKELFTPEIKGRLLKTMGAIKIDRSGADLGAIKSWAG